MEAGTVPAPSPEVVEVNKSSQAGPPATNNVAPSRTFKGDWPLANSILMIHDGIWFLEYCRAVSSGDTGRVWEILKVS